MATVCIQPRDCKRYTARHGFGYRVGRPMQPVVSRGQSTIQPSCRLAFGIRTKLCKSAKWDKVGAATRKCHQGNGGADLTLKRSQPLQRPLFARLSKRQQPTPHSRQRQVVAPHPLSTRTKSARQSTQHAMKVFHKLASFILLHRGRIDIAQRACLVGSVPDIVEAFWQFLIAKAAVWYGLIESGTNMVAFRYPKQV